jgi:8-oxo-dGTP pyrophosphatase MutT (NUDIX family)
MKLKSGRTEERGNDAKDVEFLVSKMPDIHTEQDWQVLYKHYFGKADWKPWLAERANMALSHKTKQGAAVFQGQEPLLTCLINQSEWKQNENISIFSDPTQPEETVNPKGKHFEWPPKRDKNAHATSDESGRFWGDEGAGIVFYCPKTEKVLVAKRSKDVNEPHTYGTWGGAIDEGENPKEAAQREAHEEAGAEVPLGHIDLVFTYKDPHSDFQYHNYAVVVENEFNPKLTWETEDFYWAPLTACPSPAHFGLKALWPHLKAWADKQKVASFHKRVANSDLIERAAVFAQEKHATQMRQWSGLPYFSHLEGVANIVRSVGGSPEMVAAAYLHDVIEDQGVPEQEIRELFGPVVAKLVVEMTKVSDQKWPKDKPETWPVDEKGNPAYPKRKERSGHDLTHYSSISPQGQTIKLADILHNGYDMIDSNPKFTKKTWLPEAENLWKSLTAGNSTLHDKVGKMIDYGKKKLGMV